MRQYIYEKLKAVSFVKLDLNKLVNTYFIPKYSKPQYCTGKCYLIKIPKELINNSNSILAVNWNNGSSPQYEFYKAYVNKTAGTYIYVDCLAVDMNTKTDLQNMWSGWLDTTSLTQIACIG